MNAHRLRSARTGAGLVVGVLLLAACGTSTGPTTSSDTTGTSTGSASPTPSTAPDDAASPPAAGNPGNPLYDVSSSTVDGADWDGADLAGKPAVLWFWAPWCPTCRAQSSNVSALAEKYDGQVAVVGVGGLDSAESIEDVAGQIPHVTHLVDADGSVWQQFRVTAQSTYTVLDAEGEIISEGYLDDADLNSLVAKLAEGA